MGKGKNGIFSRVNKIKVFWCSILIFVFTIPLSQLVSARLLVVILLFSFFVRGTSTRFLTLAWDIVAYLLVLAVGLLYSAELEIGFRVIETSLSLIALPLVINKIKDFDKSHLFWIFYAFAAGLVTTSLICLSNAGYLYWEGGNLQVFFFDQLMEIVDSHPTYMAYYLISALTFGLYLLYYEETVYTRFRVVVLMFLFLMLLLTGGLTAFIGILLILSFFVLKFIQEQKTKARTLTFGVATLMIICMFTFNALQDSNAPSRRNDYWERMVLWESALNANPNVVLGVGTGDYKIVLNRYYKSHNLEKYVDSNFNAHNQFIETFFSNGLIGLICLLLLLGRPLFLSVRNSNILGTLIFFPFFIYGMTEVFLGRYQGVVFFALLHQIFLVYYQSYKPSFRLKDV